MMEYVEVLKRVGIFLICGQMILHFRAGEKYTKYIKLVLNLMILIQLVLPILSFFRVFEEESFFEMIEVYGESLEEKYKQAGAEMSLEFQELEDELVLDEDMSFLENEVIRQTKEEVKSKLNNLIIEEEYQVDYVEWENDVSNGIEVYVKRKENDDRVKIEKIQIQQEDTKKGEEVEALREKFAVSLGILEENVEVYLSES